MSSNQKTFKFLFQAQITEFNLKANISCKIIVSWKRSNQSVSTTPIQMTNGKANINQSLSLPVNMYMDCDTKVFLEKKSSFSFTMVTPKGDKTAGTVSVDLSRILNQKIEALEQNFVLQKCPVSGAYVHLKITGKMLQAKNQDSKSIKSNNQSFFNDNASIMSLNTEEKINTSKSVDEQKMKDQTKIQTEQTIIKLNKQNRDLRDEVKILKKTLAQYKNKQKTKQESNQSKINQQQLVKIRAKLESLYQNLTNTFKEIIDS